MHSIAQNINIRLFLLFLLLLTKTCNAARILVVSPTPSYSHQVIFQPIWRELALRGHDVVALTTDPIDPNKTIKNLKEIDLSFAYEIRRNNLMKILNKPSRSDVFKMFSMMEMQFALMEAVLGHSEVQQIIRNETEHFDLAMIEFHMTPMMAFKERFKCPLILMSSLELAGVFHEYLGNPNHPIQYPEYFLGIDGKMGFFKRLTTVVAQNAFMWYYNYAYGNVNDEIMEKYFGKGYTKSEDMSKSLDMVFVNFNPVFYQIRPVTPATILIGGGIHIKEKQPLPQDLDDYFNNSKNGVIYMSLGGNVKSKDLLNETRNIFNQAFSELDYDVLWKFEADALPGKPDNVKIIKWAPQQDILRHPKLRLFITQAGIQSLEEALFSHVPTLTVPFYGDQMYNAKKITNKGLGLMVRHQTMTVKELKANILEIINNPKYKERVKELANLVRDEPMNALEKAVWWTEYVLRHKGSQHLKGRNIPLYQFFFLDIIAFFVVVFLVISFIFYKITQKCVSLCCGSKRKRKND